MESTRVALLVLASMSAMWVVTMAQSNSCTNVLISLSPCLNYITGNETTPSSSCCSQLANVVKSQPQCLCQVIGSGGSTMAAGLNINQTQALGLPTACNVQTPPVSRCSQGSSPGSPAGTSQATPSSTSNGGSKTTPPTTTTTTTTQGDSSNASMSLSPIPLFLALFSALAFSAV